MKKILCCLIAVVWVTTVSVYAVLGRDPTGQWRLYELAIGKEKIAHVIRGTNVKVELVKAPEMTADQKMISPDGLAIYKLTFDTAYAITGENVPKQVSFLFKADVFLEGRDLEQINKTHQDLLFFLKEGFVPFSEKKNEPFMGRTASNRQSQPDETVTTEQKLWNEVKECLRDSDPEIRWLGLRQLRVATRSEYIKTGLDMWVRKLETDPDESVKRAANELLHKRKYERVEPATGN